MSVRAIWTGPAAVVGAVLAGLALAAAAPVAAQQQARIQLNLSPAGETIVKRYLGQPDPQLQALAKQSAQVAQQQKALAGAPKFDMVQFAAAMRRMEQIQGQATRRSNDRMLQMLRELSEADRAAFVRGMANPIPVQPPVKK